MSYKCFVLKQLKNFSCDLPENGSIFHHFIRNTCQFFNEKWNGLKGINQTAVCVHDFFPVSNHNGNFCDTAHAGISTCCFNVYNCVHPQRNRNSKLTTYISRRTTYQKLFEVEIKMFLHFRFYGSYWHFCTGFVFNPDPIHGLALVNGILQFISGISRTENQNGVCLV